MRPHNHPVSLLAPPSDASAPPPRPSLAALVLAARDRLGPLFICVDAGGTKCAVAIADHAGNILGRGYNKSANMAEVGLELAFKRIRTTCLRALREVVTQPDTPVNSAGSSPSCSFSTSSQDVDASAAGPSLASTSSSLGTSVESSGPAAFRSHTPASSVVPSATGSPSSSSASLIALGRPPKEFGDLSWQDMEDEGVAVCPIDFGEIWIGIAGCDSERDAAMMSEPLSRFFGRRVIPANDSTLLCAPIIRNSSSWGVAVVAGTGSVVNGIDARACLASMPGLPRQHCRRGGHGHLLGDQGSAFDLGRTALAMAADDFNCGSHDYLRPASLASQLCVEFDVPTPADLPQAAHELDHTLPLADACNLRKLRITECARLVVAAAERGDQLGMAATMACAHRLARDIAVVVRKSVADGMGDVTSATLSGTGGCFRATFYRTLIEAELAKLGVTFKNVNVVHDAAGDGARALAWQQRQA